MELKEDQINTVYFGNLIKAFKNCTENIIA